MQLYDSRSIYKYYTCIYLWIRDKDVSADMSVSEGTSVAKVRISITLPRELVEWLKIPKERIAYIPNGVDTEEIHRGRVSRHVGTTFG